MNALGSVHGHFVPSRYCSNQWHCEIGACGCITAFSNTNVFANIVSVFQFINIILRLIMNAFCLPIL